MIIREKILPEELEKLFESSFGTVLKIAVDIERGILSAGHEYHADCSEELTNEEGSRQKNVWGANLYHDDKSIDFNSLINIKPPENRNMEILNLDVRQKVETIIKKLLCK